jgi:hypothetical protein
VHDPERDVALPPEPDARFRRAAMLFAAFGVMGVIAGAVLVYTGVGAPSDGGFASAIIGYGLYAGVPAIIALVVMAGLLRARGWARWAGIALGSIGALATAFAAVTLEGDVAFAFAPFLLWLPADREVARLFIAVACVAWGLAVYLLLTARRTEADEEPAGPSERATR